MIRPPAALAASLLLSAAIASPTHAQVAMTRTTPPESAVDAIFKRYDSKDTPGCSVAVIDGGKMLLKKSYGMADPSLGVPRTSATSHWIPYSEARVFVALAVAMLARDGKIGLDDPIRKHIPQVPAYAAAVTVRQLLHHTSGLADYGVLDPGFDSMWSRVSEDELFRALARWNKLGFAPGTSSMYSNTDFALLELLVARLGGGSLHDYLHAKLLAPLGMTN
ncbi:MAG TPA: serine hydrolase domain-containing protein, partial [Thermomonas sp.]|nr:serine hydrolase domain-containing protein [Thermomonas sp.]